MSIHSPQPSIQEQIQTLINLNETLITICPTETDVKKIANSVLLKEDVKTGQLIFERKTPISWFWRTVANFFTFGFAYSKRRDETNVNKAIDIITNALSNLAKTTEDNLKSTLLNLKNKEQFNESNINKLADVIKSISSKLNKTISQELDSTIKDIFKKIQPKEATSLDSTANKTSTSIPDANKESSTISHITTPAPQPQDAPSTTLLPTLSIHSTSDDSVTSFL